MFTYVNVTQFHFQLEMLLRQRMKGNFFEIRKQFQNNDPEGKGNVSRYNKYKTVDW